MSDYILRLSGLRKRFGQAVTADDLSLDVERGAFFTFLGPSGSGKSTILRMIAGLERPDAGRIEIDGRDVSATPPWQRQLGMMFQQYALFPHMTVAENVGYGLKVRGVGSIPERVSEMLRLVGLSGMGEKNATLLSGGEQQRVALARALAPKPKMLLLDEPLSALDEGIRRAMQTELKRVHAETGTTFLYVTHDQEEALTMSDRIAVLNRGHIAQCDAPETIYRRPRSVFVARFFRGCNVLAVTDLVSVGGVLACRLAGVTLRGIPLGDRHCRGRPHRDPRRGRRHWPGCCGSGFSAYGRSGGCDISRDGAGLQAAPGRWPNAHSDDDAPDGIGARRHLAGWGS